ncbi:MAG: MFS transporter [Gemmatimonadota bacterium]
MRPPGDVHPSAATGLPGSVQPAEVPRRGLRRTFTAFGSRNFRIFWAGALISNVGTWMQSVAQGWLVLELTDSAFLLGFTGFAASLPMALLLLLGGVFADRVDRRRLLIGLQVGLMGVALTLAALTALEWVAIWHILVLALLTGVAFAFSAPAYQALISEIVPRRDLLNAIALNSTQFNLSRILGPALTGGVVAMGGLALCFFLNAASFLGSILALSVLRMPRVERPAPAPLWDSFVAGVRYVRGRPRVRTILLGVAAISVLAMPYATMLPLFACDVLRVGPAGLGYLMAATGVGAVSGALLLAARNPMPRRGWNVLVGVALTGAGVLGFSLAKEFAGAALFLFVIGFAATSTVALCNTLIQELVTDEMRGRVMSMFGLAFMGTLPVGNLLAGAGARAVGAPLAFTLAGALLILIAGLLASLSPRLRALA